MPNTWAVTTKLNNLGYKSTTSVEEGVENLYNGLMNILKIRTAKTKEKE